MAKKKLSNDQNYYNFKKRKVLRWGIMASALATIIVSALVLFLKWNVLICFIPFIPLMIFQKMYDKTEVELSEYLLNLKEEKKKKKKSKKEKKKKD